MTSLYLWSSCHEHPFPGIESTRDHTPKHQCAVSQPDLGAGVMKVFIRSGRNESRKSSGIFLFIDASSILLASELKRQAQCLRWWTSHSGCFQVQCHGPPSERALLNVYRLVSDTRRKLPFVADSVWACLSTWCFWCFCCFCTLWPCSVPRLLQIVTLAGCTFESLIGWRFHGDYEAGSSRCVGKEATEELLRGMQPEIALFTLFVPTFLLPSRHCSYTVISVLCSRSAELTPFLNGHPRDTVG